MVSNSQLNAWLQDKIGVLDFHFSELTWPNKYNLNIYDYGCDLKISGRTHHGRGSSANRDEAIIKSFVESCERFSLKENNLNSSNGVAFHLTTTLAHDNALCELIERDGFFCHYFTKAPFKPISDDVLIQSRIGAWKKEFLKLGVEFVFGEMSAPTGFSSIITAAFGKKCLRPWGMIIGTSCAKKLSIALEKSFIEVARAISEKIEAKTPQEIDLNSFLSLQNIKVLDHFKLSLNIDYANNFKNTYFGHTAKAAKAVDISTVEFRELIIGDNNPLKNIPLFGSKAYSYMFQEAFFGKEHLSKLNFSRLEQFSESMRETMILQNIPHPFR